MLKTRIAVLVSGGGTNLQALIDAQKSGQLSSGEIVLVISNKEGAYALKRAEDNGIEAVTITKKAAGGQEAFERAVKKLLDERGIQLIVLAGFMSILSGKFTSCYPERIINVHPALIPSFCGEGYYGLRVHEAALNYGVKVTGATVHFVNEIPDGGRIILQKAVDVLEGDTPETLQRRVMEQAEWIILPEAVQMTAKKIAEKGDSYERIRDI
jgi:phosphoribosylglycinamide formyltransferase-1